MPDDASAERDDLSHFSRRVWKALSILTLFWLAWLVLSGATTLLYVIFGGAMFALLARRLAHLIADHTPLGMKLALGIVGLVGAGLLALFVWFAGPRVVVEFQALSEALPAGIDSARLWLSKWPLGRQLVEGLPDGSALGEHWRETFSQAMFVASTTLGVLGNVAVLLFVGIYLAIDPEVYERGLLALAPPARRPLLKAWLRRVADALAGWLLGRALSMGVVGVLTMGALWILDIPLVFILGLFAALLSFVPYFGPLFGFIPPALLALMDGPEKLGWLVLAWGVVQLAESYLITPLIQERIVAVPPALLIVAQVLSGIVAGPIGVIYATPITVMVIETVKQWNEARGEQLPSRAAAERRGVEN